MGNLKSLAILLVISQMGIMSLQARAGFNKIPENCAVEQSKLTELAKYARQIPQGFDKNIFGRWYAQKFLVGDVKV
ncbi:MAG: hypothetical protein KDD34_06890, partial [Bdellovibrionales bacterium]|nr:hypothetical protein [Bdellovibrionales bacterium]